MQFVTFAGPHCEFLSFFFWRFAYIVGDLFATFSFYCRESDVCALSPRFWYSFRLPHFRSLITCLTTSSPHHVGTNILQRVQSRFRTKGRACRVALQISSNPQNPSAFHHLTIMMGVPRGIDGESVRCHPPGGTWNENKRVVLWCVSELGAGEKFKLQAILNNSSEDYILHVLHKSPLVMSVCKYDRSNYR